MNDGDMAYVAEDVIAAFADGEAVDPVELERALAQPEGRASLIDLLVLRGLVAGQPAARPVVKVAPARPRSRGAWFAAAAAIAAVGVIGGYAIGTRSAAREPRPAAEVAISVPASSAPTPTQVIRLENGVDWSERGGGN